MLGEASLCFDLSAGPGPYLCLWLLLPACCPPQSRVPNMNASVANLYPMPNPNQEAIRDGNMKEAIMRERDLLVECNHQNVVGIKEAFETEKKLCLVMNLLSGSHSHPHVRLCPHQRF